MILVSITIKIWENRKSLRHVRIEYLDEKGNKLNKTKKSDMETVLKWLNYEITGDEKVYFNKYLMENDLYCIIEFFTCKTKKGFDSKSKWTPEYKMVSLI